ncbi:MAG TPA: aldo/keto reductase [Ktedonobacteraceae bacterium]|nr:aldo/keto reductase [Ktedonobacteraceae bacterium]
MKQSRDRKRKECMLLEHPHAYSYLGSARLPISRIGIGTWAIGGGWGPQSDEDSLKALHAAFDSGCQLFDTAPLYGNGHAEELLAQVIKERGKRATIVTKVYPLKYQWAPAAGTSINSIFPIEHIREQVEGSLHRLGIDCIDCLMLQTWCPTWDHERAWYETMCSLRDQGKIHTWGIATSDHRHNEANGLIEAGLIDIIEVPYNILDQRANERLLPLALKYHATVIARSPLASEALTGLWDEQTTFPRGDWRRRVFRGEVLERTVRRVNRIKALVDSDIPLAQIALRFCLSHPAITAAIPGARNAHQVRCNFAALEQGPLPQDLLDQITRLWQEDFCHDVRISVGEEGEGERRKAKQSL